MVTKVGEVPYLVSIKQAAKIFGFPVHKLYQMVQAGEVPYVEIKSITGAVTRRINTRVFAEFLDEAARERRLL